MKFAKKLFKQPEFSGLEGSADSVRQMFDTVKKKIMSDHGWGLKNGGVTTNLSNKKGEMDELDKIIKEMCMQVEVIKETVRLSKENKKDVEEATEEVVPSANVPERVEQARKRRVVQKANGDLKVVYEDVDNGSSEEPIPVKESAGTSKRSNRAYTQPAFDVRNNEVNNWLYTFMNPSLQTSTPSTITTTSSGSGAESKNSADQTARVIEEIEKHLVELGTMAMLTSWGIKINDTVVDLFDDVSVSVLVGDNFTPHNKDTYITHLTRCGIDYLNAIKVWKGMSFLFSKFNV